jgi:cytochrome c oxidase cbb3-type subunit IV
MDVNTLRIVATLACFFTFVGILIWAYSRANAAGFEEAARLPFKQD